MSFKTYLEQQQNDEQKQYILDAVKNIIEIARTSSGFEITIKYDAGEIPLIDYTIKGAFGVPIIDVEKKG